jgi:hypothetical protein
MAEDQINNDAPQAPDAPEVDSIRDDLDRAIEQVETRDAPPAAGDPKAPPLPTDAPAAGERVRGPDGRFQAQPDAPKGAEKPKDAPKALAPTPDPSKPALGAPKPPAQAGAPAAPPKDPAIPASRAPTSWKPQAREQWAKLPPEVQQEVVRREAEVGRVMQESARAREALTHVQGVLSPYSQNIAATGTDALTCMKNLFNADNTLRHGSTGDKAQLVASIIKGFGVDVNVLDGLLSGQQVAPDPNAQLADRLRQEMAAQLKPVMSFFNQVQGQRSQAMQQIQQTAGSEVDAFGQDAAHEFFDDVRGDMADIMDLYTQRGQSITLQEAYDRAIMLHPQVREIVAKRAEAERANGAAQAAQRARRTAASITSSPAPAGTPGPAADDRRAVIEAAWNDSGTS